jgi:hypothetical protein
MIFLKRLRVKLAISLSTTKSRELTRFPSMQVACNISLERYQRGLQLCFKPHYNQRFACEVIGPQGRESPSYEKCHLDVAPVERHREYYKGEGGGFPQVRAMVSLVNPSLLVVRPSTKSA